MWHHLLMYHIQPSRSVMHGGSLWCPRLLQRAFGPPAPALPLPSAWQQLSAHAASNLAPVTHPHPALGAETRHVPPGASGCSSNSSGGGGGGGSGSCSEITDEEWGEVVALLGDMAASKNRPSVSGVRRNEFELMPMFLQRVGLTPERLASLNFIHVAGTKGKGSTCAMVESVLRGCGYRTGLFTSPHLVDVRERIRVDGQMLARAEFAAAFWRVYGALRDDRSAGGMPSFFYFITLMAMDAFLARGPQLAPHVVVLEVGIGGRLDGTNSVVTPGSLAAAAVTSLGFDHMELLGDTLPKIAREKAGIMKAGRPVLVAPQEDDAMQALQEVAARVGAQLVIPPPLERYRLAPHSPSSPLPAASTTAAASLPSGRQPPQLLPAADERNAASPGTVVGLGGDHMRINAALAVALSAEWERQYAAAAAMAASTAAAADAAVQLGQVVAAAGRPVALTPGGPGPEAAAARAQAVQSLLLPRQYAEGLRTVRWPGRSQVIEDDVARARGGRVTVYLDGAHTPESMAKCATWFAREVAAAREGRRQEDPYQAGSAASGHASGCDRHATVLLFSCMRERDPAVLLPVLAEALVHPATAARLPDQATPAGLPPGRRDPSVGGLELDAALFTPMLSGGGVLLPAPSQGHTAVPQQPLPAAPVMDLSWQARMEEVWSGLRASRVTELIVGAVSETAAAAKMDGAAAALRPTGGCLSGLQPVSVAQSLPQALEEVRMAAAANPRVHVHLLVTGSLYLVGDVLRLLNKPPL